MIMKWTVTGKDASGSVNLNGTAESNESVLSCSVHFNEETVIEEVTGTIALPLQKNDHIFINGYQTWTVCPEYTAEDHIRGLHGVPQMIVDRFSLDRYGDYHFVRYPNKKGILHGESWMYIRTGQEYLLIASVDEKPGYTLFEMNCNTGILTLKRDCAGIHACNDMNIFDLFIKKGNEEDVFNAWFDAMHIKPQAQKLYGYSSWYNRYQNINEEAIMQDLQGCSDIFRKDDLFQIDDGWENYVGDWLKADDKKFPKGMRSIADQIHEDGFKAGLWLAPFVAEEKSELMHQHPDWLLKVDGKPWKCGCNWSGFYALDIDHPGVQAYLKEVFTKVFDEWGFDLVKLDFLYGAAPFGNASESRSGRMIRAMEMLRELCGDHLILGCGVPVMPAFGLVDYCRVSCDVSLDWDDRPHMRILHRERNSTKHALVNILSRRQLNRRAYLSDPDVFFLRSGNCRLTYEQKALLASTDALLGGVFLTSDNPALYTEEMKKQYQRYRHMAEAAEDVHVAMEETGDYEITYTLDGRQCNMTIDHRLLK